MAQKETSKETEKMMQKEKSTKAPRPVQKETSKDAPAMVEEGKSKITFKINPREKTSTDNTKTGSSDRASVIVQEEVTQENSEGTVKLIKIKFLRPEENSGNDSKNTEQTAEDSAQPTSDQQSGVSKQPDDDEPKEVSVVYKKNRSVEERLVDDISVRTRKSLGEPLGSFSVHLIVIVLSGELAHKLVHLLLQRSTTEIAVVAADPYTSVQNQLQMIKEMKAEVVIGTIDRINRLMESRIMSKLALKTVYFVDAGVIFNEPDLQAPLDRFLSDLQYRLCMSVHWSDDQKIETEHFKVKKFAVRYCNVIPRGLIESLHYYVLVPERNKDYELEAISQLRERFPDHRLLIFCEMKDFDNINKKLKELYNLNCLVVLSKMNIEQRTKNFLKFMQSTNAILLTTSFFNGVFDVEDEQLVIINCYLPKLYEYCRRVVFAAILGQKPPAYFYTLIYEDQLDELKTLRDKLKLKWIEKTFMIYSD